MGTSSVTPPVAAQHPLLVLVDRGCGFCLWVTSLLLRLDARGALAVDSIQSASDGILGHLPRDQRLRSWHVLLPSGRVVSAGAALAVVMRAIPTLAVVGRLLGRSPRLAGLLYWSVASRRAPLATLVPRRWMDRGRSIVERRMPTVPDGSGRSAPLAAPEGTTAVACSCAVPSSAVTASTDGRSQRSRRARGHRPGG